MSEESKKTKNKVTAKKIDKDEDIVNDCPSDQFEQLDVAKKQLSLGNPHEAVKILIEIMRGLL